jgi:hypothetical protein
MKIKTLLFTALAAFSYNAISQTLYVPSGTSGIGSSSTANVGIGISSPSSRFAGKTLEILDTRPILKLKSTGTTSTVYFTSSLVSPTTNIGEFNLNYYYNSSDATKSYISFAGYGSSTPNSVLTMLANGNVGIGTTNPFAKLQVNAEGDPSLAEYDSRNGFQIWGTDQVMYMGVCTNKRVSYIQSVDCGTGESTLALNVRGGSVVIGATDAKGYKLAVAGNMIAEKVVVKLQANWPDYVFDESHNLKSLNEIETYIKENNHLEGVPTASEIAKNGLDVANMNAILLKKVEELTLLMIEQNKTMQELQKKINNQQ